MEFEVFLEDLCVDKEETLGRFAGRQDILEKFLLEFPEDPAFGSLVESIQNGDVEAAERGLHTLKGVTGNLGLSSLYELSLNELQYVREHKCMPRQEKMHALRQEYHRINTEIREYRERQ